MAVETPVGPSTGSGDRGVRARGPVDPRLWRRSASARWHLVGLVALGSGNAALVVAQAWLLSRLVVEVVARPSVAVVTGAAPGLLAVFAGRAVVAGLTPLLSARAGASVKAGLRADLLRARVRQGTSGLEPGRLTVLITEGLDGLDGYFSRYLPALVLAVVVPLGVGTAVLGTDPLSAVIIALTLPLIPVFMVLVGWHTRDRVARRLRVQARLAHHFADLVAGLPTLQVFGRARAQAEGLRRSEAEHRAETMTVLRTTFLSALVLELLATLSVAVVAVTVGLRLVAGDLGFGAALFVLLLAPEAYLPLRQVGSAYHDSADGAAAAERTFAVIDEQPGHDVSAGTDGPDPNVTTLVLTGIAVAGRLAPLDLTIGPGEVVALAGPSGGGKSTAVGVLLGLVEPSEGRIDLVGPTGSTRPLDRPEAWRRRLAWVPQQPTLLAGTIADNVRLGTPGATPAQVRDALTRAGVDDLDPGSVVLPGGEGLSAGQGRRVAVARALLRVTAGGARLMIMDEPTAGLDPARELAVVEVLRGLGVPVLVVSHRSAVLAAADRVVGVRR